jgi:membrane-associated phospholipid phosphatase
MKALRVRSDAVDKIVARTVARHTGRRIEAGAQLATRLADEKLVVPAVLALALAVLASKAKPRPRAEARHVAIALLASCALDHATKHLFDEERPDRVERRARKKGVPRSGSGEDAFPSGHAIHLGVLASALSRFHPKAAPYVWAGALLVASTRVVVLAHWLSDVALGLTLGVGVEDAVWAAESFVTELRETRSG